MAMTHRTAAKFAALAITSATLPAFADTLVSNTSATTAGSETAAADRMLAIKFETDAESHALTSITLRLSATAGTSAILDLYSDQGLEPGSLVATLQSPASLPTSIGDATFTANGVTLDAETAYWAVLSSPSGQVDWAWTNQPTGAGAGFTAEWGISDESDPMFWWTQDGYPLQLEVTVDEESCPADLVEPFGVLDLADVQAFIVAFQNTDNAADLAAPFGVFDLADLAAFVQAFMAGCP